MSQEPNWILPEPATEPIDPDTASILAQRPGTRLVEAQGCGHEVWLYDASLLEQIRNSGALDKISGGDTPFGQLLKSGTLAVYGLDDDYGAHLSITIGETYTDAELAQSRWLEPQRTWLRLPSGRLLIESSEGSRILPDGMGDPLSDLDDDGLVELPPGDYLLTLYRIDREALSREGKDWQGIDEAIVLTPGGCSDDAVDHILNFTPRLDLDWVGQYRIEGHVMTGLICFDDYWSMFSLNIDQAAWQTLGLNTGSLLRVTVKDVGMTLDTVIATSWEQAKRLVPPDQFQGPERGYGSLSVHDSGEVQQGGVLSCFRCRSNKAIKKKFHGIWLPARIEVIPVAPALEQQAEIIFDAGPRVHRHAQLKSKDFFNEPSQRLALTLNCLIDELNEKFMNLAQAVEWIDRAMTSLDLNPLGDVVHLSPRLSEGEVGWRLYAGQSPILGTIRVLEERLDVFFISGFNDDSWQITGGNEFKSGNRLGPRVNAFAAFHTLPELVAHHQKTLALKSDSVRPVPSNLLAAVQLLEGLLSTIG